MTSGRTDSEELEGCIPVSIESPQSPDPGREGAKFLSWIEKRNSVRTFRHCSAKAKSLGFDVKKFIKQVGPEYLVIEKRSRRKHTEDVVRLVNRNWAGQWTRYYRVRIPHHGQRTETKLSVTPRKA